MNMQKKNQDHSIQKGKALEPGATIGIVAPSSPAPNEQLQGGVKVLEELGFHVRLGQSCFLEQGGYLAGDIQTRVEDIHQFFRDDAIDAIFCLRGGYGSPQLLPFIDYDLIRTHPKIFVGYSDITALHTAFRQEAQLLTFHGPMVSTDMNPVHEATLRSLLAMIQEGKIGELYNPGPHAGIPRQNADTPGQNADTSGLNDGAPVLPIQPFVEGTAQGPLVGGNLALLCATLGTPYEIDTRGKILFVEDIGEEPYRVDRMLTQLHLAGKLEDMAGMVIGDFSESESEKYAHGYDVLDVFQHIVQPYGKPVIYQVQAGHCEPMLTLPLGAEVAIDTRGGSGEGPLFVVKECTVE